MVASLSSTKGRWLLVSKNLIIPCKVLLETNRSSRVIPPASFTTFSTPSAETLPPQKKKVPAVSNAVIMREPPPISPGRLQTGGAWAGTGSLPIHTTVQILKYIVRFMGAAGTKIPDSPVGERRCGTYRTTWISGGHPSNSSDYQKEVMRTINIEAYGRVSSHTTNALVVNCGDFYVYYLKDAEICNSVYCGE